MGDAGAEAQSKREPQDAASEGDNPPLERLELASLTSTGEREAIVEGTAVHTPAPEYPLHLMRRGREGKATVRFRVDASGKVDAVEVVDTEPLSQFGSAAAEAVRQWRFEPFRRGGEPVAHWVQKEFVFKLDEASRRLCEPRTGTRLRGC